LEREVTASFSSKNFCYLMMEAIIDSCDPTKMGDLKILGGFINKRKRKDIGGLGEEERGRLG
jgi:hypothetical protein